MAALRVRGGHITNAQNTENARERAGDCILWHHPLGLTGAGSETRAPRASPSHAPRAPASAVSGPPQLRGIQFNRYLALHQIKQHADTRIGRDAFDPGHEFGKRPGDDAYAIARC